MADERVANNPTTPHAELPMELREVVVRYSEDTTIQGNLMNILLEAKLQNVSQLQHLPANWTHFCKVLHTLKILFSSHLYINFSTQVSVDYFMT